MLSCRQFVKLLPKFSLQAFISKVLTRCLGDDGLRTEDPLEVYAPQQSDGVRV